MSQAARQNGRSLDLTLIRLIEVFRQEYPVVSTIEVDHLVFKRNGAMVRFLIFDVLYDRVDGIPGNNLRKIFATPSAEILESVIAMHPKGGAGLLLFHHIS